MTPRLLLSRPVAVTALPPTGTRITVEAEPAERAALAAADGLLDLVRLEGRFTLITEGSGGGVRVRGEVDATVVQTCTVSLDPFESAISENVDVVFLSEQKAAAWARARAAQPEQGLDDEDPPDQIVDGQIDLGELTAEFLALGIDPYPRKPGVAFDAEGFAPEKDESPFAALARLKGDP